MAQGSLRINTENILPIIKKWLYSDKDIFLRELVSNACDALTKAKILRSQNELQANDEDFRIDITIDKDAKTITISDTGIGMTATEVEKYIAEVAFSGAEEFMQKYNLSDEKEQIIGHFGLGFYSAYMVSSKVDIETLSYQPDASAAFWSCTGTSDYTIDTGSKTTRGTSIKLYVDEESLDFLEEMRLRQILEKYCAFLPFPIFLNDNRINKKEPLWLKPASNCTDKDYIDFYHQLYPLEPDPIFWVHLNVDYPFNLKGILYFPKIRERMDWHKNNIYLFCNQVFVHEDCKHLLPDYLMILKGALDSPDIPLNVSRSYLQMDKTVRQLSSHIAKKISDRLHSLYTSDFKQFSSIWSDIELIIKLGVLQDDKFYDRVKDLIIWKNTKGEWTTIKDYITRNNNTNKIFYVSEGACNSSLLDLYHAKNIEILITSHPIDVSLISFLESKIGGTHFQRVDGALDEAILDNKREKTLLDAEGKTEATQIANFFRSQLDINNLEIEAKSLANDETPAFVIIDEQMRRFKDYLNLTSQANTDAGQDQKTFVINTNSKLINSIYSLKEKDTALAKELIMHLYELSLLAQKEFHSKDLTSFISRSNKILEKLV